MEYANENDLLFVNLGMGFGKSVSTWETITSICGHRAIMLNPRHDNILDTFIFNKKKAFRNFIHMQGRDRFGMCLRPSVIELSKIVSVSSICESCNEKNKCPYMAMKKDILSTRKSVMGVHAHGRFVSDLSLTTRFDCCIIDENPISAMLRKNVLYKKPQGLISYLRNIGSPIWEVFEESFRRPIDYPTLDSVLYSISEDDFKNYEKEIIKTHSEGHKIPDQANMVKELEYIIKTNGPTDAKIYWAERWEDGVFLLHFKSFDKTIFDVRCPIIVLDATSTRDYYASLSSRRIQIARGPMTYPPENVKQIIDGKYSISSIMSCNNNLTRCGKEHIRFIASIVDGMRKKKRSIVTIACSKRFKRQAEKILPPNINWIYFYGNRGTNTVMNLSDVLIVAMCPNIPSHELETNAVITPVALEHWNDILVKEEIQQTVGRLRLELDKTESGSPRGERMVIIMTDANLGYVTYTKYQIERMMKGESYPPSSSYVAKCSSEILSVLNQPMTQNMIVKKTSRSRGLVQKSLRYLEIKGDIQCQKGIYEKTS